MPHNMEPENKAGGGGASNQVSGSSQEGVLVSAEQDKPLPGVMVPEKASSFKFHPLRCCSDVCYYCGLKFGMLDTPMHIMQVWPLNQAFYLSICQSSVCQRSLRANQRPSIGEDFDLFSSFQPLN